MFSFILVVFRGYILLICICPMLKIGKLPIIASYIYLQFYLKITSRGQKYGGYFLAQLYKNSTDCFVLEILTVDTE